MDAELTQALGSLLGATIGSAVTVAVQRLTAKRAVRRDLSRELEDVRQELNLQSEMLRRVMSKLLMSPLSEATQSRIKALSPAERRRALEDDTSENEPTPPNPEFTRGGRR